MKSKPKGAKYRNLTETDLEEGVRLQWMGLAAEGIAALLIFLSLIGVFQHSDRVDLYESLVQFEAVYVPVQSTVVRDLLRDFGVPDDHIDLFAKLRTRSVTASGDRILEGEVVAWTEDGQSKTLGTIEEVREWAYAESKFYLWTSFALLMFGLVIRTAAAARAKK
jgi:hypothetical protein